MLPEELPSFRQVVEAIPAVGYSLEAMSHAEHTGANAQAGLYDQGYLMGIGDAAVQHATDPNTLFDIAIGGISAQASGQVFRFVLKRGQVDGASSPRNTALHQRINQRAEQAAFEARSGFQHESSISGRQANAEGAYGQGGQKEWNDADIVHRGILPGDQPPGTVSRLHRDNSRPEGIYFGDARQMYDKPEEQLKQEYALPVGGQYNYITDYRGSIDRPARVGPTGANDWGPGGNTQIKLQVDRKDLEAEFDFYPEATPVDKP